MFFSGMRSFSFNNKMMMISTPKVKASCLRCQTYPEVIMFNYEIQGSETCNYCFIHLLFVELNASTARLKPLAVKIKLYSLCHVHKSNSSVCFALPARLIERRRSHDYLRCWKIAFNEANVVSGVKGDGLKSIFMSVHQLRLTAWNSVSHKVDPLDSPERWETGWFIKILEVHYHPKMRAILQHDKTRKSSLSSLPCSEGMLTRKERAAAHSRAVGAPRAPTHSKTNHRAASSRDRRTKSCMTSTTKTFIVCVNIF